MGKDSKGDKRLEIAGEFAAAIFMIIMGVIIGLAHSCTPAHAQSVNMSVSVRVVDLSSYGMTPSDVEAIAIVGSPAWWTKQCCIQHTSNRIKSDQCQTREMYRIVASGMCPAYGVETVKVKK